MSRVVLITGGNLGDVAANIAEAARLVGERVGRIELRSSIVQSAPWGDVAGTDGDVAPDFSNQVLVVATELSPIEVLNAVQAIENELGRVRAAGSAEAKRERRYGSRTMDIDILFYDSEVIETDRLIVPHPMLAQREFVLRPLNEVLPDFVHPVLGKTVGELLSVITRR